MTTKDEMFLITLYGDMTDDNTHDNSNVLGIYATESKLYAHDCSSDLSSKFLFFKSVQIEETSRKQAIAKIQDRLRFVRDMDVLSNDELIELSQWWYCYELRSSDDPYQRTQGFLRFTEYSMAQDSLTNYKRNYPNENAEISFGCEKINWQQQAQEYKKSQKYPPGDPFYKSHQWIVSNYQRSQGILDVLRKRNCKNIPEYIF